MGDLDHRERLSIFVVRSGKAQRPTFSFSQHKSALSSINSWQSHCNKIQIITNQVLPTRRPIHLIAVVLYVIGTHLSNVMAVETRDKSYIYIYIYIYIYKCIDLFYFFSKLLFNKMEKHSKSCFDIFLFFSV